MAESNERGEIVTQMGTVLNRSAAQDHTGIQFQNATQLQGNRELYILGFKNPREVICPNDGKPMRLIADDARDSALAFAWCSECKRRTRPFEMRTPQMDDSRARAMGLWIPKGPSIEMVLGDDDI